MGGEKLPQAEGRGATGLLTIFGQSCYVAVAIAIAVADSLGAFCCSKSLNVTFFPTQDELGSCLDYNTIVRFRLRKDRGRGV